MICIKVAYLSFISFLVIASCKDFGKNFRGGSITSKLSLTYINLDKYPEQKNFLVLNVRYTNQSKQAIYFYYPMVVVDTLNGGGSSVEINDGFINRNAVENDSLLDLNLKRAVLETFENQLLERNELFEAHLKKDLKVYQKFRKRMFGRLIFLKPGERMDRSYFFKDVFTRKGYLLKTDTLIFKTDNLIGTEKNYSTAEGDFINILPKNFNGYNFYNQKIVSDSLTIIRKGFDPVKFEDILLTVFFL